MGEMPIAHTKAKRTGTSGDKSGKSENGEKKNEKRIIILQPER